MNPLKDTMAHAVAGMNLQSRRIGLTAENISNADTPAYRRKLLVVEAQPGWSEAMAKASVVLDPAPGEMRFEPGHPMADAEGYVTASNVALVTEMADMREAGRSYEANLNAFQQARTMYRSLLDILRR